MSGWKGYKGQSLGLARIMAEGPYSDGNTAQLIKNFFLDERGFLDSTFRLMELIPELWNGGQPPLPFQPDSTWVRPRSGVYAMAINYRDGEYADIIFLTRLGVMRYYPWNRPTQSLNTANIGQARYGLSEQYYYKKDGNTTSIVPQTSPYFPPQMMNYGNRIYWSFSDGGGLWVWDGVRVREFGYTRRVSPPMASGPERTGSENENANEGGFSHRGRIGSTESSFQANAVTGGLVAGGVDNSIYRYSVLFENTDGSYSERSNDGPKVSIEFETAGNTTTTTLVGGSTTTFVPVERLQKKFRVHDIPIGPPGTVARILLRTYNLLRLPGGSTGEYRFLHRIANNSATEYVDNLPDGELGSEWEDRTGVPVGCFLLQSFSGSLFLLRNEAYPYRLWWSEQEQSGPVPESFMASHWLDVFPATGPITGTVVANLADTRKQFMIVFKESATHYLTGEYPGWQTGTLHGNAGLAGPDLVQTMPNNVIVWYGTGTFWKLKDGVVTDIGAPIRKRLSKVNESRSRYGVSWVDREYREGIFALPTEDNTQNNMQFIYDYERDGWRLREDIKIDNVLTLPEERCTLIAGIATVVKNAAIIPRSAENNTRLVGGVHKTVAYNLSRLSSVEAEANVYVYHRSYPSYYAYDRISQYITGWMSFSGLGPTIHAHDRACNAVITGHERSSGTAYVSQFKDWNLDDPVNLYGVSFMQTQVPSPQGVLIPEVVGRSVGIPISCQTPEDDNTPNYNETNYDEGKWRDERTYTEKVAVEIESHSVHAIKLETIDPMGLYNIDIYGPNLSRPGTRNNTNDP